jgi:SAM-dependent methyltransferase
MISWTALKDFWHRRVHLPLDRRALVLDIGSGDKPHWRADLLVDFYPEEKDAIQRGGGGAALQSSPMIVGDVQNLPLRDQSVDFIVASHVIEHVPDPVQACREMERVARAGYIELPYEGMAKILDLDTHLWWCNKITDKKNSSKNNEKNTEKLVFTAKKEVHFDTSIFDYAQKINQRGIWFREVVHKNFDVSVIKYHWNKNINIEAHGTHDADFSEKMLAHAERFYQPVNTPAVWGRSVIIKILRLLFGYRKKIKSYEGLKRLLQCPKCRSFDFEKHEKGVVCSGCGHVVEVCF